MSTQQTTYESALMAVEAALRVHVQALHDTTTAVITAEPYDKVASARAIGEQTGAVDAYLIVSRMLNDYRKTVAA